MMRGSWGLARRAGLLACAVAAAALVVGCSREPATVKIGVGQPLSGPLGALGQDMVNGAKMAVDEINEKGGVRMASGHVKLELVTADDKADTREDVVPRGEPTCKDVALDVVDRDERHTQPHRKHLRRRHAHEQSPDQPRRVVDRDAPHVLEPDPRAPHRRPDAGPRDRGRTPRS